MMIPLTFALCSVRDFVSSGSSEPDISISCDVVYVKRKDGGKLNVRGRKIARVKSDQKENHWKFRRKLNLAIHSNDIIFSSFFSRRVGRSWGGNAFGTWCIQKTKNEKTYNVVCNIQ